MHLYITQWLLKRNIKLFITLKTYMVLRRTIYLNSVYFYFNKMKKKLKKNFNRKKTINEIKLRKKNIKSNN